MPSSKRAKAKRERRRLQPDARRLEILASAERLLREDNRGSVRVEDIVREAGAAKGTFYLYFSCWDDLVLTLRERIFERFEEQYRIPEDLNRVEDWLKLVDTMAVGFIDFTLQLGGLHRAVFHSSTANASVSRFDTAVDQIAILLEAGVKANAFAKVDVPSVARLLFAMLHEAVDAIQAGEDRARLVQATREILRRILQRSS